MSLHEYLQIFIENFVRILLNIVIPCTPSSLIFLSKLGYINFLDFVQIEPPLIGPQLKIIHRFISPIEKK